MAMVLTETEGTGMEIPTITLPVTVAGSTRDVVFRSPYSIEETESVMSGSVFTGRIGNGIKTHNASITAWKMTRERARKLGYDGTDVVEVGGFVWAIQKMGYSLNRQVLVTGWREDAEGTSQHIMEASPARSR